MSAHKRFIGIIAAVASLSLMAALPDQTRADEKISYS